MDLCLALGLPILVMSWHVVVQGHRFDIVQRVGCQPSIYWSYPAVFLIFIWPPILLLASSIYAGKWGHSCYSEALLTSAFDFQDSPFACSLLADTNS